ncbi:MAG: chromosome segregation protein SMC [Chloroflexota bacterium]|nr:chromosome segregation protein SMC [Chloroflexota bacterium]
MRLKHLYLYGFKTFAPKTDLSFGEGLTAIVGPNGSGKSNVADAVRWVLGEQSLSNLRAKRTEDLVFAGSSNRAPLGMAEVSITIDNSDRLLPLEFAEVTLTRRAYRSGENEYYVNKSRVRLRDVLDVASTLGQAYTVVGQGLVDAALSLRPEERRELFEEAAGIRGYFVQREDALKRLTRTEENMARVNDLASELEPQVRRMERQARQAQEYGRIDAELREVLRDLYVGRWLFGIKSLEQAQHAEKAARVVVNEYRRLVAAKSTQLAEARRAIWELVESVSRLHEQRAQLQARHAAKAQLQAVSLERLHASRQGMQAIHDEARGAESSIALLNERLQTLERDLADRATEMRALQEAEHALGQRLAEWDRKIASTRARYNERSQALANVTRRMSELQTRYADSQRRMSEQQAALAEGEAVLALLQKRLAEEENSLEERNAATREARKLVAEAEKKASHVQSDMAAAHVGRSSAEAHWRDLGRQGDSLMSQLTLLAGEQQANLHSGVRAVVSAAGQGKLHGFVGTVAELLRVPTNLEAAIEAALGGRLQDVVLSTWGDAEEAIAYLKRQGMGRATFLPLDTLRASPGPQPPRGHGIVGVARDIVDYDPHLTTLAESLLGRLLIVEDLPSARGTLSTMSHNASWTLATLDGEVVRPGGSVTGGSSTRADDSRARGKTILARERKRRELLAAQESLLLQTRQAEEAVNLAAAALRSSEAEVGAMSATVDAARKAQATTQMAFVEKQGAVSRLQQEHSWRAGLLNEIRNTIHDLTVAGQEAASQATEVERRLAPISEEVAAAEAEQQALTGGRAHEANAAGADKIRLAVLAEGVRNVQAQQGEVRRELARQTARLSDLRARAELGEREEVLLGGQLEVQAREVAELGQEFEAIEGLLVPSESKVRVLEEEVGHLEVEQSSLQAAMLDGETAHSHAAVEEQRWIGILDSLRVEIEEELGGAAENEPQQAQLVAADMVEEALPASQRNTRYTLWPEPLREQWGAISAEEREPNGHHAVSEEGNAELERRKFALKARLSRLGPVNPLATEEYNSLNERHAYLVAQMSDLTGAGEALRRAIAELDRTMRDQFAVTFEQVNEKFQYFFSTLFGGGSARLELTNPHDVAASGVELFAQPPGKRMQPLAALSGGERALTSAALLFALLKVRPVPFCVLDEVDAALDESNVTRFREALAELGDKTQFVIISHNRGTIEAASTLYGVSMAGDGTSQILSLRIDPQE